MSWSAISWVSRPCAAEDDAVDIGIIVGDAFESLVFVFGMHHVVDVAHVLGPLVAAAHHNLLRVVHVGAGNLLDFARHGGPRRAAFCAPGAPGRGWALMLSRNPMLSISSALVHDDGRNVVEPHGFSARAGRAGGPAWPR